MTDETVKKQSATTAAPPTPKRRPYDIGAGLSHIVFYLSEQQPLHALATVEGWVNHILVDNKRPGADLRRAKEILDRLNAARKLQLLLNRDSQDFCTISTPSVSLRNFQASADVLHRFQEWLLDNKNSHLLPPGLITRNRLLLHGPPGTGKTFLAKVIATELEVPLVEVNANALIDSFLGSSAKKVDSLFKQIIATRAVYFIDEVDALSAYREYRSSASRENSRISIAILRGLDQIQKSASVLVAATNHLDVLDAAMLRRFHLLEVTQPTLDLAAIIVQQTISEFVPSPKLEELEDDLRAIWIPRITGAYLVEIAHAAVRGFLLHNHPIRPTIVDRVRYLRDDLERNDLKRTSR